jgi:F-type H+-transporting ATPase subunit a
MKKWAFTLLLALPFSEAMSAGGYTWVNFLNPMNSPLPNHVVTFGLIAIIIFIGGLLYRSRIAKVTNIAIPDKGLTFRNFTEAYGQFIYNQCKAVIGEDQAHKYFGFVGFIFIFILLCNLAGLIPGFLPPTEFLNTTLALGIFSFIYYNVKGVQEVGFVNYMKHFAGPLWYMAILIFPIEIISNFIRPMSLALRLRGNMYGDHTVLHIFSNIIPDAFNIPSILIPMPFYILGTLVSLIQAYVFTVLSMVYISLATAHHDHDEHGHH